jgi:hypothetical protein
MFRDMAATDSSSMAMAMAFYPLQGQGLTTTTTTTTTYNPPHHHNRMLSFTASAPDPTLIPPATTSLPSPPKKYKFVTASPADWTAQEVATLEEGLIRLNTLCLLTAFTLLHYIYIDLILFARYACEPNITKYIKIAAMLPDKTIRDVALRCCWTPVSF